MTLAWKTQRLILAAYLRPQWRTVAILALVLFGSIALQLAAPQVLRQFIDRVTAAAGGSPGDVALLFLAVAVAAQVTAAFSIYISERVSWTATNALRADLALHVLRLDMGFHTARSPGELVERVDGDVTQLSTFFSQLVIRIIGNGILLAAILVLLYREDGRVGLAYTAFTLVALAALRRQLDVAVPHWKEARQAGAALLGFLEERLAGTEDIRSSGAVPYTLRRLIQIMREQLRTSRRAWYLGSLMWATTVGLVALGNGLAFGFGAYLLRTGAITIGTIYLFFHYTEMLRRPLEQITRQMQELQRASASVARISDLFALRPTAEAGDGSLPPGPLRVEFRGVTFAYESDEPVLRDLSFALSPGQILGLLGRTGSGKTTVGRLLARLYDPAAGAIHLDGRDIREVPLADLRSRVAVVTQDVQLFHAPVRDNLTFFDRGVPDERILAVLDDLGLRGWVARLPEGLDTILDPRATLSAGEAQLLAFARVFFKNPGLVILDEPSSRLDPVTERLIERAVAALLRDRTGIIIAHRLDTVQRADEIMILEAGQILESGPRAALAADPASRFARLLRAGLEEVLA